MRRLFLSAGVLLLSAPLFLLAGAALTPGHTPLWLLPSAVGILLALAVRALPKRARIPCALLGMALAAGFAALLGRALNVGDWVVMPALLAAGAVVAGAVVAGAVAAASLLTVYSISLPVRATPYEAAVSISYLS